MAIAMDPATVTDVAYRTTTARKSKPTRVVESCVLQVPVLVLGYK